MLEILKFIFSDWEIFFGMCFLIYVIGASLSEIVYAIPRNKK